MPESFDSFIPMSTKCAVICYTCFTIAIISSALNISIHVFNYVETNQFMFLIGITLNCVPFIATIIVVILFVNTCYKAGVVFSVLSCLFHLSSGSLSAWTLYHSDDDRSPIFFLTSAAAFISVFSATFCVGGVLVILWQERDGDNNSLPSPRASMTDGSCSTTPSPNQQMLTNAEKKTSKEGNVTAVLEGTAGAKADKEKNKGSDSGSSPDEKMKNEGKKEDLTPLELKETEEVSDNPMAEAAFRTPEKIEDGYDEIGPAKKSEKMKKRNGLSRSFAGQPVNDESKTEYENLRSESRQKMIKKKEGGKKKKSTSKSGKMTTKTTKSRRNTATITKSTGEQNTQYEKTLKSRSDVTQANSRLHCS